jgi:hypothetical protein
MSNLSPEYCNFCGVCADHASYCLECHDKLEFSYKQQIIKRVLEILEDEKLSLGDTRIIEAMDKIKKEFGVKDE